MAELGWDDIRQGTTSPADDDAELLQSYDAGAFRLNATPGSPIIGWRCSVAGHAGTWEAIYGGLGGPITLRAAYLAGSVALDQTLPLSDADGGGVILDGSSGAFTGALSFRVNSAASGPFAINRANGYVGIGQATPVVPLHISVSDGSGNAILLDQSSTHQRIIKSSQGGFSLVVPNTGIGTNWFQVLMGVTSKFKIEPGNAGGLNGVITFNNSGVYLGTFAHWAGGETIITQQAAAGSTQSILTLTSAALTTQFGVDQPDVMFDLSHTVQKVAGSFGTQSAFQIKAPTYAAVGASVITDVSTMYIDGAPTVGTNYTFTRRMALWIGAGSGAGNGGGIRTDGFGASGLIKNNNGGLWTLGVAGTDYVAPWSLTLNSIVVSGGGSLLVEDNANFFYLPARHRAHSLTQTVLGGSPGVGQLPTNPTLTFNEEVFDVTETVGAFRDSGIYGIFDDAIGVAIGGYCYTNFTSQGVATYGLMTRYIYGGTEAGRDNDGALVIYGGSAAQLLGLQFRATAPYSSTGGTQRAAYFNYLGYAGGFAPVGGTAKFRALEVAYEVEQSGGANGEVVGLAVTSTPTAVGGAHYGIRVNDGTSSIFRTDGHVASSSSWVYVGESGTGAITSFSGIQAFTNARSAQFYVLNSYGNAWHSNVQVLGPASSAAVPTFAIDSAGTSGIYGYSSTVLGASADGRHVTRWESTSTTSTLVIGQLSTGVTGWSMLAFETNARSAQVYLDNASNYLILASAGLQANALAGTGSQLVQANASGQLSRFSGVVPTSTVALTGPAVVWTDGTGLLNVDTTNFVWDATAHVLTVGVGSVTKPSLNFAGNTGTGAYLFAAHVVGIAGDGRLAAKFNATATDREFYLGESASGVTGLAYFQFDTNARSAAIYLSNSVGNALISTVPWYYPNGSASVPSIAFFNAQTTGFHLYTTDTLGITTAGRNTGRWESTATARTVVIGEFATGITGTANVAFATNARTGTIYLDNAVGNALISTVPFYYPNGSAAAPSIGLVNSQTTGIFRYAADSLAFAAAGRYVARFESDSVNRFLWLGEQGTGITGVSVITFDTNSRRSQVYLDNTTGNELICTTPFSILQSGLGIYRVGSGILGLAGTNVDVPSLSAGGIVKAAATTGRLGIATNLNKDPFIAGVFDNQYGPAIAITPFDAWCPVGSQYPVPAAIKFEYLVPYACTGVRFVAFVYAMTFPGINTATIWVTVTTAAGSTSRFSVTTSMPSGFTGTQDLGDLGQTLGVGDRIGVEMDLSAAAAGTATTRVTWDLWLIKDV